MYWISFAQIVSGLLIYQASQKAVPKTTNPFLFIALAYGVGMVLCLVCAVVLPATAPAAGEPGSTGATTFGVDTRMLWCALGLGIGATLIEIGYFMGYRSGWPISELPIFVTIATSVCLTLAGAIWFREELSLQRGLGLALCVGGIVLVLKK